MKRERKKKGIKNLLKKYGSLEKIKNAPVEELSEILPYDVAVELSKYLNEKFPRK